MPLYTIRSVACGDSAHVDVHVGPFQVTADKRVIYGVSLVDLRTRMATARSVPPAWRGRGAITMRRVAARRAGLADPAVRGSASPNPPPPRDAPAAGGGDDTGDADDDAVVATFLPTGRQWNEGTGAPTGHRVTIVPLENLYFVMGTIPDDHEYSALTFCYDVYARLLEKSARVLGGAPRDLTEALTRMSIELEKHRGSNEARVDAVAADLASVSAGVEAARAEYSSMAAGPVLKRLDAMTKVLMTSARTHQSTMAALIRSSTALAVENAKNFARLEACMRATARSAALLAVQAQEAAASANATPVVDDADARVVARLAGVPRRRRGKKRAPEPKALAVRPAKRRRKMLPPAVLAAPAPRRRSAAKKKPTRKKRAKTGTTAAAVPQE